MRFLFPARSFFNAFILYLFFALYIWSLASSMSLISGRRRRWMLLILFLARGAFCKQSIVFWCICESETDKALENGGRRGAGRFLRARASTSEPARGDRIWQRSCTSPCHIFNAIFWKAKDCLRATAISIAFPNPDHVLSLVRWCGETRDDSKRLFVRANAFDSGIFPHASNSKAIIPERTWLRYRTRNLSSSFFNLILSSSSDRHP